MPKFYDRHFVSLKPGVCLFVLAGLVAFALTQRPAFGGKLKLNIKAGIPEGNTILGPQDILVRASLPPRVGTNDIINLDGFELGYDVGSDSYYVYKTVTLDSSDPATRTTSFDVEINDIWVISREEIEALRKRADGLVEQLEGTDYLDTAEAARQQIATNLVAIETSQDKNSLQRGVGAKQHTFAYEADLAKLQRVKNDIGHLENLVLGTGQDPGTLVGDIKGAAPPVRDIDLPEDSYGTGTIRIKIRNMSPRETQTHDIVRYLPLEIKLADVLDSGGLQVESNRTNGMCYVYTNGLVIGPLSNRTFNVKIRDKWNINRPRVALLKEKAQDVLVKVGSKMKFSSVEELLNGLVVELEAIEQEVGPEELNDKYVAFYREQAGRIDFIEQRINRIESALKPMTQTSKFGFEVKAPSSRTTWAIIYVILGFLAVMSVIFFLRWFSRTKAEALSGEASSVDEE